MMPSKRSGFAIISIICVVATYMLYSYQRFALKLECQLRPPSGPTPQLPILPDKLCIHTLPENLVNQRGDMPVLIPPFLQLPEPILACLYHRYVTTLQTLCIEPKLFGHPDAGGGYICVDGDLIREGDCTVAVFHGVVGDTYTNQLKTQRRCDIINFSEEKKTDYMSSFDRFLTDQRSAKITMLVFLLQANDDVSKMHKLLSYLLSNPGVLQIAIKIYYDPEKSSGKGYTERLSFFRNLYNLGYRIFFFDRNWECVPPAHANRQALSCYTIYFIKPLAKQPQLVTIPSRDELQRMDDVGLLQICDRFLSSLQILCRQNIRLGNVRDGGWNVCHGPKYRPKPPCIIYSFGISYDFSFDDATSEIYGCNVYSFDPSMNKPSHKHSERVWFYNVGIAEKDYTNDKGWSLRTLGSIMEMLNHTGHQIDILKMDVESSEWPFLTQVLNTHILDNVGQLYFEFHFAHEVERLLLIKMLYDKNFRIFWTHKNPNTEIKRRLEGGVTTEAFEVYFINTNFYK